MMYILKVLGFANDAPCSIAGQYLKSFDHDTADGRGFGVFTRDQAEAMRFESGPDCHSFWKRQSKTVPLRPDGEPNRPLTASHMEIVRVAS